MRYGDGKTAQRTEHDGAQEYCFKFVFSDLHSIIYIYIYTHIIAFFLALVKILN